METPDATVAAAAAAFDWVGPILSTGIVGVFLLMILFRYKIMPIYVYDDAKSEWERERSNLQADIVELKAQSKEANALYVTTVVPVMTRVADAQHELLELRRDQERRNGTGSH